MKYQEGCGAIHAIGNGEIMLYGRGPEWMQVLGSPYSCPTVFSLVAIEGERLLCESFRQSGSSIWHHRLPQGEMMDLAPRGIPCIVRSWSLSKPLRMELDSQDHAIIPQETLFPDASYAWLIKVPADKAIYNDYPLCRQSYMMIVVDGELCAEKSERGFVLMMQGVGSLYLAGAGTYPACVEIIRRARAAGTEALNGMNREEDSSFLRQGEHASDALRAHSMKEAVVRAAEDTAFQIRAQQHSGGGVQAGHNYHLAYVRDQYGVSRGLIAMGYHREARAILQFYREIFSRWGFLCNAQAMGVDGIFHRHECEASEITGYLLMQAVDLLDATGDTDFFRTLLPMLDWALEEQRNNLHNDMLPFNGDETYIAGRILPRTVIYHGSFEATMLFVTAGRRYLECCRRLGLHTAFHCECAGQVEAAAASFDRNFRRGNIYIANSLIRLEGFQEPEFRHGVCYFEDYFGWLHHETEGCYVCPSCLVKGELALSPCREEFSISSTILMAPFLGSDLPDRRLVHRQIQQFSSTYEKNKSLPSLPGGKRSLGYDYGLMLFAMSQFDMNADKILDYMLSLQDACGCWAEYYDAGIPAQTRCRPWESAINIAGAYRYLEEHSTK